MASLERISKYIFLLLVIGLIFFLNLKAPLDPDLGWHLRSGQDLIQTKKVPLVDNYSYTMPNWERISHDWLSNGFFYFIYANWGLFVLSIIFALITIAAFLLISRVIKVKIEYSLLATLLGSLGSLPMTGIRVQVLTLLGLSLLFFILFRFRRDQNKKTVYLLPLLFLVWVNLHGGFSVGLFVLGLFLFFEGIKIVYLWLKKKWQVRKQFQKELPRSKNKFYSNINRLKKILSGNELIKESLSPKSWLKLSYVSFFSFAATFINPHGYKIYSEIISWMLNPYSRSRIGEWGPFNIRSSTGWEFILYLTLLTILALFYFKKIDLTLLGSGIVFGFLAFSSWRNMPLFIVITIPLWVYIVKNAADPVLPKLLTRKFVLFLFLIAVFLVGYQQTSLAWKTSRQPELLASKGGYPKGAVDYIKANLEEFQGNMFNEYNWGGYLIWQLPEKKVFIDGRMPGFEIFREFNDLKALKNPKKIIEKYNIDWVLLYKNQPLEYYLKGEGWNRVYEDDLSVIYKKEQ